MALMVFTIPGREFEHALNERVVIDGCFEVAEDIVSGCFCLLDLTLVVTRNLRSSLADVVAANLFDSSFPFQKLVSSLSLLWL